MLFFFLILLVVVLAPPVAVWRWGEHQSSPAFRWIGYAGAILGPVTTAFCLLVLLSFTDFEGQCGGWLGETSPCGFAQFAGESLYWGALSLFMPGALGIALGLIVLVIRAMWRGPRTRAP